LIDDPDSSTKKMMRLTTTEFSYIMIILATYILSSKMSVAFHFNCYTRFNPWCSRTINGNRWKNNILYSSFGSEQASGSEAKVNIIGLTKEALSEVVSKMGQPAFRGKQLHKWLYDKGASCFADMSDLPKAFREKLETHCTMNSLETALELVSKDGTIKRAYRLHDGQVIESVLMPYDDGRRTACISSQAGCAMGCVFCATGQMGFARQLTSAEIIEQVYRYDQILKAKGERLSNIVFMGMGEPLNNYKNVMEAVRFINQDIGIGARHITISTVGLVPKINKLSEESIQVKLAISLHASNDADRNALLPVNRRFNLKELMDSCKNYIDVTGRRITFEYALIAGENDTPEVANELGKLLKKLHPYCHVNLIPLNPTQGFDGGPSQSKSVNRFIEILAQYKIPATPRVRRGIDIDAGCGQLKSEVLGKGL